MIGKLTLTFPHTHFHSALSFTHHCIFLSYSYMYFLKSTIPFLLLFYVIPKFDQSSSLDWKMRITIDFLYISLLHMLYITFEKSIWITKVKSYLWKFDIFINIPKIPSHIYKNLFLKIFYELYKRLLLTTL